MCAVQQTLHSLMSLLQHTLNIPINLSRCRFAEISTLRQFVSQKGCCSSA
jgi:hypothetical protein